MQACFVVLRIVPVTKGNRAPRHPLFIHDFDETHVAKGDSQVPDNTCWLGHNPKGDLP